MSEKFKEFLKEKGISPEQFQEKNASEMAKIYSEYQDQIETKLHTLINEKASAEDVVKLRKELEEQYQTNNKALTDALNKLGLQLQQIKEIDTSNGIESIEKQVKKFISENAEKIKQLKSAGHGFVELQLKAVDSMQTTSASLPSPAPALVGTQQAPATNVNLRGTFVDEVVTTFSTDLAAYAYTESIPKDGDYSFVAEKGTKPQIDFEIETRYAQPVKVAAHMVLTEESVTDIRGLQNIATDYLRKKHDLRRQKGILYGNGISPNPKGATEYGRLFVAGAMANAVTNPNFMDVVNAAITDVYTTHNFQDEMPYKANLVLINPIDFFIELVAAKDSEGRPLYPMASLFNMVVIGGVRIMPDEEIAQGEIFVCDMSKYNITDYVGYTIRIGWINDQFVTNQFTMVGESRFHAFVKKLDEQAFVYDDIQTIKTAITKP